MDINATKMAIVRFDKWFMFKHGEVCLYDEEHLFTKQTYVRPKKVLREETGEEFVDWEPRTSLNDFKYSFEFVEYGDNAYAIKAVCTNRRGQTTTLTMWISSKRRLVDAHDLIFHEKIIPVWEKLIGFMKECTTV